MEKLPPGTYWENPTWSEVEYISSDELVQRLESALKDNVSLKAELYSTRLELQNQQLIHYVQVEELRGDIHRLMEKIKILEGK